VIVFCLSSDSLHSYTKKSTQNKHTQSTDSMSSPLLDIATELALSLAKNRAALTALKESTNACLSTTSESPSLLDDHSEYQELLQLHHATLHTMQKLMNHIHTIKLTHNQEMLEKNEQVLMWKNQVIEQFTKLQQDNIQLNEKLGNARETLNTILHTDPMAQEVR
jgi:hypothetical protein